MNYSGHYAKKRGIWADITADLGNNTIQVITHKGQRKRIWKLSECAVYEFGSMNPKNSNYVEGGKLLKEA